MPKSKQSVIRPSPYARPPKTSVARTKVFWDPKITLKDTHPVTKIETKFIFTKKMIANPLTSNPGGYVGSEPNGKALWWPLFQARHKDDEPFWVQGHLLNDNVYGPGEPENLLPISRALNANMEALVESFIKNGINNGREFIYIVEAHWDGAKASKDGKTGPEHHPEAMRKAYGLRGVDPHGTLLWGEQFAPSKLSWSVQEIKRGTNGIYASTPLASSSAHTIPIKNTYKGKGEHFDDTQWSNQFPAKT